MPTLTREEKEIIEELIVWQMCKRWDSELACTDIFFRPGLILVDCATKYTVEYLKIIVAKLVGGKGAELLTYAQDYISEAQTMTFYLISYSLKMSVLI